MREMKIIGAAALAAALATAAPTFAATLSNPVADGTIVLDSSRDDWTDIARYADDGNEGYPIDIGYITIAHDSTNLYVRYQMYNPSPAFSGNWKLLIDTDQNPATGYHGQAGAFANSLGAEILIEGASTFTFSSSAAQDNYGGWNWVGFGGFNEAGAGPNDIELAASLAWLGNPTTFNFILWVDSNNDGGISNEGSGGDDMLPNGAYGSLTPIYHTYTLVPEPASLGLLVAGSALALRRRR